MLVLGIESSCDETAAAVVDEEGRVLSDIVRSQAEVHRGFGGVVPELAARDHLRAIVPVVEAALTRARVTLRSVDALAVTTRPGLAGALLVGAQVAETLAFATRLPLVPIDHLVGHLLAVFLRRGDDAALAPRFPFVALLASGGHTALYRVDGPFEEEVRELGATRDDAAGEAYDKVAKLLGLGYPGGPIVDGLAQSGDPAHMKLPTPMLDDRSLEMSFSGIKSAIARRIATSPPVGDVAVADLCASFQRAVTTVLAKKLVLAARREGISRIVLGGGVAANRGLRARAAELARAADLELFVPPIESCTDNAAMIAYAGAVRLAAGRPLGPSAVTTRSRIPRVTRKGRGSR